MLAVPPALLDVLHLDAGSTVGLTIQDGKLVVETCQRPKYTMAELLRQSDYSQAQTAEDREWSDAPACGGELI
jgi:antitoxin ChpS